MDDSNSNYVSNLKQKSLLQKELSQADYLATHEAMLACTLKRVKERRNGGDKPTTDELWIVEHNDVYTIGQAGKKEHILVHSDTPIIKTDRGGQVTWHGKGQLVIYWLFDLISLDWKVRDLVSHAEQAIEDVVNSFLPDNYIAKARSDAPGVYIFQSKKNSTLENSNVATAEDEQYVMLGKIASLGFKIKHGFSYHGIALNLSCDLSAFNLINPCGYAGMQMLRLADFINENPEFQVSDQQIADRLIANINARHKGDITLR